MWVSRRLPGHVRHSKGDCSAVVLGALVPPFFIGGFMSMGFVYLVAFLGAVWIIFSE